MAFGYVGGDRDQLFLLPVSMRDWLEEGHLAWFVVEVVERVDLSRFHARYRRDGPGRPAYDPQMMLGLLFYAYATGVRSSRRVEAACRTDAAFRVIAGGMTPDHATLARFVVDHQRAIEAVFFDVLRLCAAAGLVSAEWVAIDGTKMAAAAAIDQNRSGEWIRAEVARMVAEVIATDAAEEACVGLLGFADRLPVELSSRAGRQARLQAALDHIEAQEQAERAAGQARSVRAQAAADQGRKLAGRKPADPHQALGRAESDYDTISRRAQAKAARRQGLEAGAAAQGRKPRGRKPRPDTTVAQAQAALEAARQAAAADGPGAHHANIVDPDSRIMASKDGFVQGYNCQAAVNEHQIVIAGQVTQQANDVHQYQPMVAAAQAALAAAGVTTPIGRVLADAGYWSDANATSDGPERLIATRKDWKQRRAARDLGTTRGPPPPHASPLQAMEHTLRTAQGAARYAKRSHTVEPVFANGKQNRGFRHFRRRGLAAVTSEWSLITTVHNLGKLFAYHQQTGTQLLAT